MTLRNQEKRWNLLLLKNGTTIEKEDEVATHLLYLQKWQSWKGGASWILGMGKLKFSERDRACLTVEICVIQSRSKSGIQMVEPVNQCHLNTGLNKSDVQFMAWILIQHLDVFSHLISGYLKTRFVKVLYSGMAGI